MRQSLRVLAATLAILPFANCSCDPELARIPEPEILVSDEAGTTNRDADPWLKLDFGDVDTGSEATETLTILSVDNGTNAELEVTLVCLVAATTLEEATAAETTCLQASSAPFAFSNIAGTLLPEGESVALDVQFRPQQGGPSSLFVRIESNDEETPVVAAQLIGRGTAGALCADNLQLDFGDVYIDDVKTLSIVVENCGVRPVEIDSYLELANPDGVFSVLISGNPVATPIGPLAEGETVALDVTFAPTQVRVYREALAGIVQMTSAEPYYGEYTFIFEGTAIDRPSCRVNVVPNTVQFGAVASQATADRDLIIQSVGGCACEVTAIDGPTPADNGFAFVSPPTLPIVLAGTQGCEFDPAAAEGAPTQVTLPIRYTAPDRAQPQVDNATVEVTSTDASEPVHTVFLEANGGGTPFCQFEVTPEGATGFDAIQAANRHGLASFGRVTVFGTKRVPINFHNVGNQDCTIDAIEWDFGPNTTNNEFALEYGDGTPVPVGSAPQVVVAAGDTASFNAVFAPTMTAPTSGGIFPDFSFGSYSGSIQEGVISGTVESYCNFQDKNCNGVKFITSDTLSLITGELHGPGEFSIGFSATPVEPAIDIIPGELDFGLVTLGCGSPEQRVNVYNTGGADLEVGQPTVSPVNAPADFVVTATSNPGDSPSDETSGWPYIIPPGGSMGIFVRFYANQQGPVTADLVLPTFTEGQPAPPVTVPLSGEGTLETDQTDLFDQFSDPTVDVLFVVDDSGSMSPFLDLMATNFSAFFTASNVDQADYHIAVTTTLTTEGNCLDPFGTQTCAVDPMCGHYTACSGNDRYLDTSSTNPSSQFSCNVRVSESGNVNPSRASSDSAEGALQAAKEFLSAPKIDDPAINGGFLRELAKLHVVMVSDEVDQSEGPASLYVDFFKNIKGFRNESLIAVSAIATPESGCTMSDGTTLSGDARYPTVVDEMNGRFQPICEADWTTMMQNLGLDSLGLQVEFFLTRAADAISLDVCVRELGAGDANCVPVAQTSDGAADGYFYDPASNSIVFNPGSVPPRGAQVQVYYETYCYE